MATTPATDQAKPPRKPRSKTFSQRERDYVAARAKGLNSVQAAQAIGAPFPRVQGSQLEKRPAVQAALKREWERAERVSDVSKKQVMDGMLSAIEQAKLLADPTAQIAGWREVAKMCGYYEPRKVQLEVSVSAKRMFSQFETLSDEELLKLVESEPEGVIDVEPRMLEGKTSE